MIATRKKYIILGHYYQVHIFTRSYSKKCEKKKKYFLFSKIQGEGELADLKIVINTW